MIMGSNCSAWVSLGGQDQCHYRAAPGINKLISQKPATQTMNHKKYVFKKSENNLNCTVRQHPKIPPRHSDAHVAPTLTDDSRECMLLPQAELFSHWSLELPEAGPAPHPQSPSGPDSQEARPHHREHADEQHWLASSGSPSTLHMGSQLQTTIVRTVLSWSVVFSHCSPRRMSPMVSWWCLKQEGAFLPHQDLR